MSAYQPPFRLNHAMLSQVALIGEWLGRWKQAGDCSGFISFMLDAIGEALEQAIHSETPVETPVETRVETPVKARVATSERILKILLEQPTLTLADVAVRLGKSLSAVERAAGKLREQGRLRYVGPQKGGHWEA